MDMNKKIWVYDESGKLISSIKSHLDLRYSAKHFDNFTDLQDLSSRELPDLMVVYFDYQNQNFLKLLQANFLREKKLAVIVVSTIDDLDLIQFMYQQGVVDYQLYPFNLNLFLSKVNIVINNNLHFIPRKKTAIEESISNIDLTFKETKIIKLFMESEGLKLNRDSLVSEIWGEMMVHYKTLDVHIYNLRRKLVKAGLEIKSEGAGYFSLVKSENFQHVS